MIRVLIAEDSALQRNYLKMLLESDPEIQVVGMATNGVEAVQLASTLKPDLITMDIRMPVMDGFEATRRIMQERPIPIVVVSSSVEAPDLAITFNAIKAGAVEVIEKPNNIDPVRFEEIRRRLIVTVKGMSLIRVNRRHPPQASPPSSRSVRANLRYRPQVVVIGVSTGGPMALSVLFKSLPRDFPLPIVTVQHMASGFTTGLVEWMQTESNLPITIASENQSISPGRVYMAPDDCHLVFVRRGVLGITHALPVSFVRPSATVLFNSAAQIYGAEAIGVILTGMGSDGALGLQAMHQRGATTLVQDEMTSVVYGMPKAAIEIGAADQVLPLQAIAPALVALTKQHPA